MAKKVVETPLMKQYFEMKAKHPDAILLFRVGDFYETFSDDAITSSEILGITLTRRANGAAQHVELAGFPHHALDTYLPKLIRAGKRVAICEQLEDPKLTKKLVKRDITELVTPGVAINDNILDHRQNNFLAALHFGKEKTGVSFLDISTGEFLAAEGTDDYIEKVLTRFAPKEVLVERGKRQNLEARMPGRFLTSELDDWIFTVPAAMDRLLKQFETDSLKGFGIHKMELAIVAAGAILHYLDITSHTNISHITALSRIDENSYVRLDNFTIRNLELINSMSEEGHSLLNVIDRTVTPMGARLLRRWILFPLMDVNAINRRLDVVQYFFRDPEEREAVLTSLQQVGDLERLLGKVATRRISPREVGQLRNSLAALVPIKRLCGAADEPALQALADQINTCDSLRTRIATEIVDEPPGALGRGHVIREGVNAELDELRYIATSGKDYLLKIQARESKATGITSLKVGFNNVFGYYIEVTNTHRDKVPQEWIRKQTLVNAERYITPELKEYEEKILGAQDKIEDIEARLFNSLVTDIAQFIPTMQLNASMVARIDVLSSFTTAAIENHYNRPIVDDSLSIDIVEGRHPVIEKQLPPGESYISSTVRLDNDHTQIMMITGPNMSGKSALLRLTALNTLMAQMGCFVAAESARIGVVDKIFTRVGASDNISLGESTFMVEMIEAASILNNMSQRSLILFDELGRGTSTFDGISIAWAIVEHIHNHGSAHPKTLFATHYHELNEMEGILERVVNYNIAVREINGKVVFLRRLEKGGSEHSFGIHVAKIAGMPRSIIKRADEVLKRLEANSASETATRSGNVRRTLSEASTQTTDGVQLSFFQLDDPVLEDIRDQILGIDINNLSPLEALNRLAQIKEIITGR